MKPPDSVATVMKRLDQTLKAEAKAAARSLGYKPGPGLATQIADEGEYLEERGCNYYDTEFWKTKRIPRDPLLARAAAVAAVEFMLGGIKAIDDNGFDSWARTVDSFRPQLRGCLAFAAPKPPADDFAKWMHVKRLEAEIKKTRKALKTKAVWQ